MRYLLIVFALLTGISFGLPAWASDVVAIAPIRSAAAAPEVCRKTCMEQDCGWSGEWRRASGEKGAVCDCGTLRNRAVPGGYIRSLEDAKKICPETCELNGDAWNGKISSVAGGFDMCGCTYVADYCPPKDRSSVK